MSKEKVKTEVTEVCNETDKKNINANLTLFPNEKKMEEPKTLVISEEIYDPRSEEEERLIQQKIEEIKIKVNAFIGKIPNLETVPALVYRKLALDVKDDYCVFNNSDGISQIGIGWILCCMALFSRKKMSNTSRCLPLKSSGFWV